MSVHGGLGLREGGPRILRSISVHVHASIYVRFWKNFPYFPESVRRSRRLRSTRKFGFFWETTSGFAW